MPTSPAAPWKKWWLPAVKVAVSAGLLYGLARSLDLGELRTIFAQLPLWAFLLGCLAFVLQTLVLAWRWRIVMTALGTPLAFGRLLPIMFIGIFFNQVLPTSFGGDALRMWHVYRAGVRHDAAILGVLLERISGIIGLTLMVAAGTWYLWADLGDAWLRLVLLAALPATLGGTLLLMTLDRIPGRWRQWRPLGDFLRVSADLRCIVLEPRFAEPLLGLSLAGNALAALSVYAFTVGLGLPISAWACLALVPAAVLAMLIPISFAGWGLREAAMVVLFGYLGVAPDVALALSIAFGLALIVAALPGCVLWLLDRSSAQPGTQS